LYKLSAFAESDFDIFLASASFCSLVGGGAMLNLGSAGGDIVVVDFDGVGIVGELNV
jgi:hypothetical protein